MSKIKMVNFTYTRRDDVYTAVRLSRDDAGQLGLSAQSETGAQACIGGVLYRRAGDAELGEAWFRTDEACHDAVVEGTAP